MHVLILFTGVHPGFRARAIFLTHHIYVFPFALSAAINFWSILLKTACLHFVVLEIDVTLC